MTSVRGGYGFQLKTPNNPLERVGLRVFDPCPDEVVVEVAGCGVCHTDVAFATDGVPTRHPLPLILGHEISGRVVAAGENAGDWLGRAVIVPAVISCGVCPACRAGRSTICRQQFMPGNDGDGGFATHVLVPSRGLCAVPEDLPSGVTLEMLCVVADAVTTPYEAIRRSGLGPDDVAVIVGAGGVGGFGVQIAAAVGAAVVAIDVDQARLDLASRHGAGLVLGLRWILEDVPLAGDPLFNLASAHLEKSSYSPVQHDLRKPKEKMLIERIRNSRAEAAILTAAKMCEPGLEEQVAYLHALDKEGTPYFISEFEEKMTTFEHMEIQLETFVENILFS